MRKLALTAPPLPGSSLRKQGPIPCALSRGHGVWVPAFAGTTAESAAGHEVTTIATPLGLVLAGGLARRMGGGDKARIRVGGATILQRVLGCIAPQCARVIINANGDPARFADTGLTVVADEVPDFAGPLAGILAGLDWAAANVSGICDIVSVPGDCPFLPPDLVARLAAAR